SIIQVDDVWKRFRIPHQKRSTILEHVASLLAFEDKSYEEFWALKNIHFSLARGESLGIIGPNGSGKSTLLKLMARVMKPNKGTIETTGSIAPILELGVGFHGDLSVKENAEVYGIILGISRSQMKRLVDPIIQFASLEKFRDTRLKHLSSGMQIRLAFSIAIQTAADIFLVDEALAVGDMEFQQKCLEKFRELKKNKKSIVLVSHDLNLIENYCEKCLYLLNGETVVFGTTQDAIRHYLGNMKSGAQKTA
ncbi:MAG TPA: ABC transporter ATP-binding protein, partial [Candidatus Bathyarchaeia archaeon]|nr:ABC transporter ATP-binding protein [Candidatus Bathyarchaeia archaeon]